MTIEAGSFSRFSLQLRTEVLPLLATSALHEGVSERFDSLLHLTDKLLLASSNCVEVAGLREKVDECLEPIWGGTGTPTPIQLLDSIELIEPWLKLVLWIVDRAGYNRLIEKDKLENKKLFNLHGTIQKLKLMSEEELKRRSEDRALFTDPATRALFVSKEDRNGLTHEARRKDPHLAHRSFIDAIIALISTVDRLRKQIAEGMRDFVVRRIELPEPLAKVLGGVRAEYKEHTVAFKGRRHLLEQILSNIRSNGTGGGEYILYTAQEGFGKSALAAKLSSLTATQQHLWGEDARAVENLAPWLSGTIFHAGKQSRDPFEITCILISQANAFRLNAEPFPEAGNDRLTASLPQEDVGRNSRESDDQRSAATYRPVTPRIARVPLHVVLQRALYQTFMHLAEERGKATIVLDALDEITTTGEELSFLPPLLPPNVTVILTSRPSPALMQWAKRNLQHLRLEALPGLTLEDAVEITGEPDGAWNRKLHESSDGSALVIREKTFALAQARRASPDQSPWLLVDPATAKFPIYEHQSGVWKCIGQTCPCESCSGRQVRLGEDPLQRLLELFAAFEPVSALSLDHAQGYLSKIGHKLRKAELLELLRPVGTHLVGLTEGRAKLGTRALADHVWRDRLSIRDRRETLNQIVDWLASDPDAGVELTARFLEYWCASDDIENSLRACARKLISPSIPPAHALEIAQAIRPRSHNRTLREQLLRIAITGDLPEAQFLLSHLLGSIHPPLRFIVTNLELLRAYGIEWRDRPNEEGLFFLQKAAEAGHIKARLALTVAEMFKAISTKTAQHEEIDSSLRTLIDERNLEAGVWLALFRLETRGRAALNSSVDLLLELAEHSPEATALLANVYLDGVDGEGANPGEGIALLQQLRVGRAGTLADWAQGELIDRLFSGDGIDPNPAEGLRLLKEATETGDEDDRNSALIDLSSRYFDGDGVPSDAQKAFEYLRKATTTGSEESRLEATITLAEHLLDSDGEVAHTGEALQLLRTVSRTQIGWIKHRALLVLAERLLDGNGVPEDEREGLRHLRNASQTGNEEQQHDACIILATRLLDGVGVTPDAAEGLRILKKLCDSKSPGFKAAGLRELGCRYIDGKGVKIDIVTGMRLLSEATQSEDKHERHKALAELGERLVTGRGLPKNVDGGLELLRQATNEPRASLRTSGLIQLALTLFSVRNRPSAATEAVHALKEAAESRIQPLSSRAKLILGSRLIDGTDVATDTEEGLKFLWSIAKIGSPSNRHRGLINLARRYLDGKGVPANESLGRELLNKACVTGSRRMRHQATLELANRLVDGKGLQQNLDNGLLLLEKVAAESTLEQRAKINASIGLRYLEGRGPAHDPLQAQRFLNKVQIKNRDDWSSVGYQLYQEATTSLGKERAGRMFLAGFRKGDPQAGNNLAYLIRRGEFVSSEAPSLGTLLRPGLRKRDSHSLVNEALRLAFGVQGNPDWEAADAIIRGPSLTDEVLDWWGELAEKGEAEGHLVLGWLVKYGKATDPQGMSFQARFEAARRFGVLVPEWMNEDASGDLLQ